MARSTFVAVLVVLLLAAAAVFVVENSYQTTQLEFDLGRLVGFPRGTVAAWQLEHEVSIPALIGICFGAGLLVGGGWAGLRMMRLSSRIRQLEQQVAVGSAFSANKEPGSW